MQIPKLTDISTAWITALEGDAGFNAWCVTNLGGKPVLFNGADRRDQPGKKTAPFILVDPDKDSTGLGVDRFGYQLVVVCCIEDERGGRTQGGDGGRVITFTAQAEVEAFAARVLNVLAGTDYPPEAVEGEIYDERYPLVMKGMTITTATEAVMDGSRTW